MDYLSLIGRDTELFSEDISHNADILSETVKASRFLVIGGAGTIGQAVTREIFKRDPLELDVVDLSENSTVELVRDLRSTLGYGSGVFRTFAIDSGGLEFESLIKSGGNYDYVFNLSALKHVRSEKDPYTLMRMINVNVLNTMKTFRLLDKKRVENYFCVSTDKAANPVNMMGASKRIMELFLMRESERQAISAARFANVAFSDGSLLHGFNQRFSKQQPITAPTDVKRYFVTPQESGELCLLAGLLGANREIFFPKLSEKLHLVTFSEIAKRFIKMHGYTPHECDSEEEARARTKELIQRKLWPCYFFTSDTTGEKDFEEFFTDRETLILDRYSSVGVIRNTLEYDPAKLDYFLDEIRTLRQNLSWERSDLVRLFHELIPSFAHSETGKFLDQRM